LKFCKEQDEKEDEQGVTPKFQSCEDENEPNKREGGWGG
jgi:hypothetical protein